MLDSAYSVWSSLHLVARVLLVSIAAANINASALKVVEQIRNCPNQAYTMDVRVPKCNYFLHMMVLL